MPGWASTARCFGRRSSTPSTSSSASPRCWSTKAQGKAGRIASSLLRLDAVVLDEMGYLPFSQAGGALLFHLLSKLYEPPA